MSTQRRGSHLGTRLAALVCCGFLVTLAVSAGISLAGTAKLLPYDGETTDTDGCTAYLGYRIYRGEPAYTRADRPPYTPPVYGPLVYLVPGAVGRLLRPASFHEFLVETRALTLALFLLIAVLAYRWARRWNVPPLTALAAPLLVLSDPAFFPYAAGHRPDVPALFFALLGFSILSKPDGLTSRQIAAAGFLMGLAFLFKQSFLAAPAAAFLWLLRRREYRLATVLTTAALAPAVAAVGGLELLGQPVLVSLLMARHRILDLGGEARLIGMLLLACPVAGLNVWLGLRGVPELRRRDGPIAALTTSYLALAAAVGLATMANVGAARYYLMETLTICSFLAPLALDRLVERLRLASVELRLGATLALVAPPAICASVLASALAVPLPHWGGLAAATSGYRVLSDETYVAAQGKDPEMVDTFLMSILERNGQWSPAPVLRQVQQREFDYVILAAERTPEGQLSLEQPFRGVANLSPAILREVQADYRFAGTCVDGHAAVFVPPQQPRGTRLARRLAAACGWQ